MTLKSFKPILILGGVSAGWCSRVLKETLTLHGNPEIFNT